MLELLTANTQLHLLVLSDFNLNKPSGSKGARHHAGASARKGPMFGELNVQS